MFERRTLACVLAGWLMMSVPGCGEKMPDGPRVEVYPITGSIRVDGQPAEHLRVKLHPIGEASAAIPTASDFTDPQGRFEIGTYEAGDGAPPGEYRLTFFWGQYNLMNGQYGGPDKLKGRYDDPETSEHLVVVIDGLPTDMGTIELTTR